MGLHFVQRWALRRIRVTETCPYRIVGTPWPKGAETKHTIVSGTAGSGKTELANAMEGTTAQSIVVPQNPKTALSVRAMLTANIGTMDLLPDEGAPFSIRAWIEREDAGRARHRV